MEKILQFMDELDAEIFSLRLILMGNRGRLLVPALSIISVTGLYLLAGWIGPLAALGAVSAYRVLRNRGQRMAAQRRRSVVRETGSI